MKKSLTCVGYALFLMPLNGFAANISVDSVTDGVILTTGTYYPYHSTKGKVYNSSANSYQELSFDINDPASVEQVLSELPNLRNNPDAYKNRIAELNAALSVADEATKAQIQDALYGEFENMLATGEFKDADWSGVRLANQELWDYDLTGINGITGVQLAGCSLYRVNLSGIDMTGKKVVNTVDHLKTVVQP